MELLFEVLDNARMMGITDLEKEVENFLILNLVAKNGPEQARLVFNVLNHAIAHQFHQVVEACLSVSQELLETSAMESPDGGGHFWLLDERVWKDLNILSSSSGCAPTQPILSPDILDNFIQPGGRHLEREGGGSL